MAKSRAYTKEILPVSHNDKEDNSIHQSSPAWVLTFIRWDIRDTRRAINSASVDPAIFTVREPLVVESDCIQVSTTVSKSTLTPSMSATLLSTDINYMTAVAPGDFVFVNMLNWPSDARRVANVARQKSPGAINGPNDGFKGLFKVQSVRKTLATDPSTGTKFVVYRITGYGFTEFNNKIYFNPYLLGEHARAEGNDLLFAQNLGATYKQLIGPDKNLLCQDIIRLLIQAFIGTGVSDRGTTYLSGSPVTANTQFYVPELVGKLLGINGAKAAKDLYNYLFGIQAYNGAPQQDLSLGMNPIISSRPAPRFFYTGTPVGGQTILKAEYWNDVSAWSIVNQYVNKP